MGTKNNPGQFDCYANAAPDEPMFILLGRDPLAALLVRLWADVRERMGTTSPEKLAEARHCAAMMVQWAEAAGKDIGPAREALAREIASRHDETALFDEMAG